MIAQIFFALSVIYALIQFFYHFTEEFRTKWIIKSRKLGTFLRKNEFLLDKYWLRSSKWEDCQLNILVTCFQSLLNKNILDFVINFDSDKFDLKQLDSLSKQVDWFDFTHEAIYWQYSFWFFMPDTKTIENDVQKRIKLLMECKIQ